MIFRHFSIKRWNLCLIPLKLSGHLLLPWQKECGEGNAVRLPRIVEKRPFMFCCFSWDTRLGALRHQAWSPTTLSCHMKIETMQGERGMSTESSPRCLRERRLCMPQSYPEKELAWLSAVNAQVCEQIKWLPVI